MDAEIREGLALANALMHGTDDFVVVLDSRGVILEVNEAVARRSGRSPLSLAGSVASDLFPPAVASRRMAAFESVRKSGKTERFEDENDGRFFDHIVYPILGSDGKVEKVVAIARDITARRRAAEELLIAHREMKRLARENASILGDILQKAADGICVCHNISEEPYVRFTHWNPRMTDITGYTLDEINELGWYQTMYPDPEYQRRAVERMAGMREGKDIRAEEWVVMHKDGEKRILSISTSVLKKEGEEVHVLAVMQEITERKRVEEVRESIRRRVEDIQQIARIGDWEWDVETGTVTWSKEVYSVFGLEPEKHSVSYDLARSLVHPDDLRKWEEAVNEAVRELGHFKLDYRALRQDGSVVWIHNEAKILRGGDGKAFKLIGTAQDITERKEAEEALKASEKKYRNLIGNMHEVLYAVNHNGQITFVSPSIESITQYRDFELIHHNMEEFVFRDDLPRLYQNFRKCLSGIAEKENEYRLVTKSGKIRWMRMCSNPIYEGAEVIGVQGIFSDITERKQAEEALHQSEERFRIMADTSPALMWINDLNGCRFVNRAYREFLGLSEDSDAAAHNWVEFIHPEDREQYLGAYMDCFQKKAPFEAESRFLRCDGAYRWMKSFALPKLEENGDISSYIGSTMDITDLKVAQEGLRALNTELEKQVQERTANLQLKNEELQEFAFVASHDLNEPLRKIQAFGTLLQEKSADHLTEEERGYVSRMTGAANRMQELLNALLRYSRVETTGEEFVPTKLDDIVRTVATDLEVAIQNIGARVEIGPLPSVQGDPSQLRQLFQNLIANALKYHRSELELLVRVYGEENTGAFRIFVEDNGIGFEEKYLEKIFQPFQRLHGRNDYPGTGIGLAICRKIVERHKGTITAKSTPGKGSTFIVSLPVRQTRPDSQ